MRCPPNGVKANLSTPWTRCIADGTLPGPWIGSGLLGLGIGQLHECDEVTEAQFQLLIGIGSDALTGSPMAFPARRNSVVDRVEALAGALDAELGSTARGRAVATIEAAAHSRSLPTHACAELAAG